MRVEWAGLRKYGSGVAFSEPAGDGVRDRLVQARVPVDTPLWETGP